MRETLNTCAPSGHPAGTPFLSAKKRNLRRSGCREAASDCCARRAGDTFTIARARTYASALLTCWAIAVATTIFSSLGAIGFLCLAVPTGAAAAGTGVLILALPTYMRDHIEKAASLARQFRRDPDAAMAAIAHLTPLPPRGEP